MLIITIIIIIICICQKRRVQRRWSKRNRTIDKQSPKGQNNRKEGELPDALSGKISADISLKGDQTGCRNFIVTQTVPMCDYIINKKEKKVISASELGG